MWIKKILVPPSSTGLPSEFSLSRGVNIIRGDNGIGKTTILECASLLGHVGVMNLTDEIDALSIELCVCFHESDIKFLNSISQYSCSDGTKSSQSGMNALLGLLTSQNISTDFEGINHKSSYSLKFKLKGIDLNEVKDALSCDAKIRDSICVYCSDGKVINAIKALNLWSRPVCEGTEDHVGPWKMTPRTIEKRNEESFLDGCGSTFYINTDMYEFGSGLDVRESPKELKDHLATVMIRRLQLLTPGISTITQDELYLDTAISVDSSWQIDNFEKIVSGWKSIFESKSDINDGDLKHPLEYCIATRLVDSDSRVDKFKTKFRWAIGIAGRPSAQFVSSGENQAIFILAMLCNYAAKGSCVIIDEPELHLSFTAGSRLVNYIIDKYGSDENQCQFIMVTHLPHLYRDRILDLKSKQPAMLLPPRNVHFIYLKRMSAEVVVLDGMAAADAAAESSHEDVVTLSYGLQLEDNIPMFEWSYLLSLPPLSWISGPIVKD